MFFFIRKYGLDLLEKVNRFYKGKCNKNCIIKPDEGGIAVLFIEIG